MADLGIYLKEIIVNGSKSIDYDGNGITNNIKVHK
jgi:hypothetical protein